MINTIINYVILGAWVVVTLYFILTAVHLGG